MELRRKLREKGVVTSLGNPSKKHSPSNLLFRHNTLIPRIVLLGDKISPSSWGYAEIHHLLFPYDLDACFLQWLQYPDRVRIVIY